MILKIFKTDIKKIFSNLICVIIVLGVLVLPSLYAWFNIAALWDPYANTGAMAVAVVNNDKGTKVGAIKLDIGDEIYHKLKENTQIGWTFVDNEEAQQGVESGKYYAAIIIPEDFSDSLVSVVTEGKVSTPTITYLCNEKKNAIAPKITEIAVGKLQTQVNETFLSTLTEKISNVLGVTKDAIDDNKTNLKNGLNDNIDSILNTLDSTKSGLEKLSAAADKTTVVLEDGSKVDLATALNKASDKADETNAYIKSITVTASSIESSMDDVLSKVEDAVGVNGDKIKNAINSIDTNPEKAINELSRISGKVTAIAQRFDDYAKLIDDINILDLQTLKDFSAKLRNYSKRLTDLAEIINDISSKIEKGEKIPQALINDVDSITGDITNGLEDIKGKTSSVLKPELKKINDKADNALNEVKNILGSSKNALKNVDDITEKTKGAVEDGNDALKDAIAFIDGLQTKLENVKKAVNTFDKDGALTMLLTQFSSDPDALGEFIAKPVTVETEKIYETSVYGNGMSPFYTTLAIWVAGLVLIVCIKARFTDKDIKKLGNPKQHQMYLGRLLTYLSFVVVQTLIIGLGDLMIMGVQCYNVFLFLFACVFIGIVFTIIIYTFQYSFGDIGKAIIVIVMILQIGGSGGLYPVECVPEFFQNLYPYLPFTYAINALRECISGFYGADFWLNLLYLSVFIPIMLLIGLVIRLPFAKLMKHFEESKERSDIIL